MLKLINSDCMTVMSQMPGKSVTLTLTDIPYGEVNQVRGADHKFGFTGKNFSPRRSLIAKGAADSLSFSLENFCKELCRLTTDSIYIFCGLKQASALQQYLQDYGTSTRLLIWEKTNAFPLHAQHMWISSIETCVFARFSKAVFNGYCRGAVLRYPIASVGRVHPTQKPLPLIIDLLVTSSNRGDTVFDPCMGSGTTGVAAVTRFRNFIGIEQNREWFEKARDRVASAIPLEVTSCDLV